MKTYNHAFTIAFEVRKSPYPNGDDIPANEIRNALQSRLDQLPDDELLEAVGLPFDTFEHDEEAEFEARNEQRDSSSNSDTESS